MADSMTVDSRSTPGDGETSGSNTEHSGNIKQSVQWAGKIADGTTEFASKTAENLSTGVTQLVGWTYENTKVESRGLRPMHVRVSVRVHHVSFLHPGLDSGSRATIRDTSTKGRFRFGKKAKLRNKDHGPPGLLKFGKKSGSWKNPNVDRQNLKEAAEKIVPWNRSHEEVSTDPADVAEIVSAEAFRLSRDGIIQQHYALEHAVPKQSSKEQDRHPSSPRRNSPGRFPHSPIRLGGAASPPVPGTSNSNTVNASTTDGSQTNPYSAMLSPETLADPEGAARYYKECAARPKGYRRLVVSSLPQRNDVSIPSPPKNKSFIRHNISSFSNLGKSSSHSLGGVGESEGSFETNASVKDGQMGSNKDSPDDEGNLSKGKNTPSDDDDGIHNFDKVEYRYVGPPNTGPEFFQLLRKHGAATFGRYLPELACSVPNHSYNFELIKSKRRAASTQPIVYECPHIIWGDARDTMLSKIAKEGCPLIDGRPFEYASNANLDDARLSESLLLCGSTIWVKRAKDGDGQDKGDHLEPKKKKTMVEAEYHVSKFVDGVKDGVSAGVKGINIGTKATVKGAQKVVDAVEKTAHDAVDVGTKNKSEEKEKKKSKLRSMFSPKKRRQKGKHGGDGMSVDGSLVSGQDDYSISSEPNAPPSLQLSDHIGTVVDEVDDEKDGTKSTAELKSSPYVLLLDDVIYIRIVSFPDKHEIARFPISVASVMVQRSMEDRMNDPFKPSELTCNFIQEPSAPELRWGVTLKVTVRAVQVKPGKVSRLPLSPKLNEKLSDTKVELQRFKDKMNSLGKSEEEISEEMKKREEQIKREESELDEEIKTYGYGKLDESDYGPSREIRLRQMFYCEREHKSIIRKSLRRHPLTEDEVQLLSDANLDPSSAKQSYDPGDLSRLLHLLDIHFPGIEEDQFVSKVRKSLTSSLALQQEQSWRSDHALQQEQSSRSDHALTASGTDQTDELEPSANDVFASVSFAMAKSLAKCFEDDAGAAKTVQTLEKQIMTASTIKRKKLDAKTSKLWVSRVSNKLASCLNDGTTIAKVSKVLLESAMDVDGLEKEEEEMKMDEDQIALSESEESANVDTVELADWCAHVASKLNECAIELEALYSPSELYISSHSLGEDKELKLVPKRPDPPSASFVGLTPTILSMSPRRISGDSDNALEGMITRRLSSSGSNTNTRRLSASTTISTIADALPSTQSGSKAEEVLIKMKTHHLMKKDSFGASGESKFSILNAVETPKDSVKVQYNVFYVVLIIAFSLGAIIISAGIFRQN